MHSSVLSNVNDYLQDKSQQIQELKGENTAHLKNKIQVAQSLIQQCENLRNSFTHQVTSAKENNELLLAYLSKLELEFSNAKNELDNIAKQKHAQKVVTAISQQLLIRQ
jgi:chromosome segregation ATPase